MHTDGGGVNNHAMGLIMPPSNTALLSMIEWHAVLRNKGHALLYTAQLTARVCLAVRGRLVDLVASFCSMYSVPQQAKQKITAVEKAGY